MTALYNFLTDTLNTIAWIYILLPCVFVGGLYFTIGNGAIQFRHFHFAMKNTLGKVFRKKEAGEGAVTPLQAVTTALAATVGTGNIVGTSQAIALGGYGAIFWLWCAALLGMCIKYCEVALSIKYRERDAKGDWVGGPMYYIKNGLGPKWKWLAVLFSLFGALAAFGIGNMSQANSIMDSIIGAITAFSPDFSNVVAAKWIVGILLATLTAVVLFGGIKRIGSVTEKLVPIMALLYIIFCLVVIFGNISHIGDAFGKIFEAAFAPKAVLGAGAGITTRMALIWGLRRSAFSNEAGLGSAPIAHAAADTEGPVHQGLFGIFEVFMDTIVICTMTALTIIISEIPITFGEVPGTSLISTAFGTVWGGKLSAGFIALALIMFAYSTMLGWSLYGTRCAQFLFGMKAVKIYQVVFVIVIVVGCVSPIAAVWNIADTLNGLMAIPNFIALFALSPVVFKLTKEFFKSSDYLDSKKK